MSASRGRPLVGLYPGTFDPITRGHEDLIGRGLSLVDELVVAVAADTGKASLFTVEERLEMVRLTVADEVRVEVAAFDGLTVEFAKKCGASLILRGLRALSDFEYEFQMALMNKHLAPEIEILFMAPDATFSFLSSSLVREVALLGGDVSAFVSPAVAEQLMTRYAHGGR